MHSKFSPSSAYRWTKCTRSLDYHNPDAPSSPEALEGRKAHEVCEHLLNGGKPFKIGTEVQVTSGKILYDETLHEAAQLYVNTIRTIENQIRGVAEIERQVHLTSDIFGTPDAIITSPFYRLAIVDFKYGAGIAVSPVENPQLLIYAAAVLRSMPVQPPYVDLYIVQPRTYEDKKVKVWTATPKYICNEFVSKILRLVDQHNKGISEPKPGKYCHWCPGATECPAISRAISNTTAPITVDQEIQQTETPDPRQIKQLTDILNAEEGIKERLDQLKATARNLIMQGHEVPGYKLVQSVGNHTWTDPEKVKRKFGLRKSCEYKLLSPTQLQKALGPEVTEWVKKNVTRPDRGLKLVPWSDKRPAYRPPEFPELKGESSEPTK